MARDFKRSDRVAEFIRQEVGDIIGRKMRDPNLGLVTVTGVKMTKDLQHANVLVSVLGDEEEREQSLAALRNGLKFIRTELGRRSTLRNVPELHFSYDDSVDNAMNIEALLKEIKNEGNNG